MSKGVYVVGVDVGTTGAKAVVVRADGTIVAEATSEYDVLTPKPLWAEQWPDVWLQGLSQAVQEAVERSRVDVGQIAGMAVSSLYGGSGIPCDNQLEPIYPCLIWMDRRAEAQVEWVRQEISQSRLFEVTGNGIDSYYGFTKMLWLKENEPDIWRRTAQLVPPNAYLIYRLTGELAIDLTSAGNIGGIFDHRNRTWSNNMLGALGIPESYLPDRLVASTDVVGTLTNEGARLTGLAKGTPVCAGGIDAAVATLSAGCLEEGQHVAMIGTSMCWGFIHRGMPQDEGFVSMPYALDPHEFTYTFGGAATAGAVVKWFRDHLGEMESWAGEKTDLSAYTLLDAKAARIPPGADGLILLPYFMGERSPIWDSRARGTLIGLTLYHTKAHVYRAFLEGVAFALRHNVEAGVEAGYSLEPDVVAVGGGVRSDLWCQIFADVLGRKVHAARAGGEAALGDAMLAAVGLGLVDRSDLKEWVKPDASFAADVRAHGVYSEAYQDYIGLYEDLKERFIAMAERRTTP